MTNHRLLSVAVIVAVVLAGCSGFAPFGGGSGDDGTAGPGSSATASAPAEANATTPSPADSGTTVASGPAGTPSPTPAGSGTATGATGPPSATAVAANGSANGTYPAGYNASGVVDPRTAVVRSQAALNGHDSYTVAVSIPTTRPSANVSVVSRVDLVNQRQYQVATASLAGRQALRQEQYQNETRAYAVSAPASPNGTAQYNATTRPFSPTAATSASGIAYGWLTNASFGDAQRVTRGNETFFRYRATGVQDPAAFLPSSAASANASVSEFNASLVVDRKGIIRSLGYSITYATQQSDRQTTTGMVRVGNIDATTVAEPAWLDAARANTSVTPGGPGSQTATARG